MGGKTNTTKQSVQVPKFLETAYKGLVKGGAKTAAKPLQTYTGSRVAGFSPLQQQGIQQIQDAQGAGIPYLNAASQFFGAAGQGVDTYDVFPQVQEYNAQNLQQYMDPYQQQVIDATLANIQRSDAIAQQQLKGSGIGAGVSPGLGDRMGLAAAELERNQALARNQTIAGITSQGFNNAQNALLGQQNLQLSGLTSDAARQLQAAGLNASNQLAAAQGYAGLGNQVQDMYYKDIDALMSAGLLQQQQSQQQLDNTYNDWLQRQGYDKSQIEWLANLVYGQPKSSYTQTTQTPAPSALSQIAGLGTAALGLFTKRGGAIHRDDGGRIPGFTPPTLDTFTPPMLPAPVAGFQPVYDFEVEGPDGYSFNALPHLRPRMTGHEPRSQMRRVSRPLRKIFRRIGRAEGGGVYGDWNPDDPGYSAAVVGALEPPPGPLEGMATVAATSDYDPGPPVAGFQTAETRPGSRTREWFRNKNLPLIYAGLGIAAGDSPWPLQNVGSGALAGLKAAQQYAESEANLDAHPVVDDSGEFLRIWYPSESRWEETNIPSTSHKQYELAKAKYENPEPTALQQNLAAAGIGPTLPDGSPNPEYTRIVKENLTKPLMGPGETEYDKKTGEYLANYKQEAQAAVRAAQDKAIAYGQIAYLLGQPGVYTGTGGEAINALKRAGATLLGLDMKDVEAADVAARIGMQAALGMRTELPGPMSDSDRKFLLSIPPNIGDSAKGVQLLAKMAAQQAEGQVRNYQKMQEIMSKYGGKYTEAADQEFQNWLIQNPIWTPEIQDQIMSELDAVQKDPLAGTGKTVEELEKEYGVR